MPDAEAPQSGFKRYFCPHCGYDVSATPRGKPCPECGQRPFNRQPHIIDSVSLDVARVLLGAIRRVAATQSLALAVYALLAIGFVLPLSARPYIAVAAVGLLLVTTVVLYAALSRFDLLPGCRESELIRSARTAAIVTRILAIGLLGLAVISSTYELRFGKLDSLYILIFILMEYISAAAVLSMTVELAERMHSNRLVAIAATMALFSWPGALTVLVAAVGIGLLVLLQGVTVAVLCRAGGRLDLDLKRVRPHTPPSS